MFPINLVLFHWRLIFDTKLKETSLPVLWLENIGWKIGPSQRTRTQTDPGSWLLGIGRWWRDPSTNWSFFSKWSGTGLGVILVLNVWIQLNFVSRLLCVQSWFSVSARSIDRDSLVRVRILYPVSYRVSYLDLCLLNMNLNKGRLNHSSWSALSIITSYLLYTGLAIEFSSNIFNVITDLTPFVN